MTELEKIKAAAEGLLFMSESDHPLEIITINPQHEVEKEIKTLSGKDDSQIEIQTVDHFFRNHIRTYPDEPAEQTVRAKRFVNLVDTLKKNLDDVKVYRIGSVQVDAFIIGKLKDGSYAGLRTKLIET